jgi:hypothetical protein
MSFAGEEWSDEDMRAPALLDALDMRENLEAVAPRNRDQRNARAFRHSHS